MEEKYEHNQHSEFSSEAVMTEASPIAAGRVNTIDEIVALIVSGQSAPFYVPTLDKLNREQLTAYTSDGLDPLTILNPVTHSAAYLYFITARCLEATETNSMQLYQLLDHFIRQFDPEQVRIAAACFTLIGSTLLHLSEVLREPLLPLLSFRIAIERFAEGENVLTSLHAPFLRACIRAKAYRYPLYLLDHDIEIIQPNNYDVNIRNFLEYYYYGAILYIGNKKYDRALEFLTIVISAPTQQNVVSAIQIAAYKKFVLASLITDARIRTLPKYTAPGVEKACRFHSTAYINLSKAFEDTNIHQFNDTLQKSSNVFRGDNHMGLVKQCYQSLRRKKIKELTKVYITVGLEEMARKIEDVSPEELEHILIEMINQNHIQASISVTDQHIKMVHFNIVQNEEQQKNIEDRILEISTLNDRVAYMNKLEGLNRIFQGKVIVQSRQSKIHRC
ncbi:hypothetical protein BDF20DRAFT_842680 [Mycotypha africana]|uniref:uncharacterized protein n=1 Tax=Mycotypha africana TaxID=64632 RepID=UPI0023017097|nr:uncharacterized protein BDF20DRAFT_842680 [Mycotypha africana]KAI8991101.1 hypothetical protein BDF20DRAFT_842680 [Mycotypha africana]